MTSSSTVQLCVAGVGSTFLVASMAWTENWCDPTVTPEKVFGETQAAQLAASSLHSKLEPDSLEEKAKLAEVEVVVAAGPLVIEVCGGVVSGGGGGGGSVAAGAALFAGGLGGWLASGPEGRRDDGISTATCWATPQRQGLRPWHDLRACCPTASRSATWRWIRRAVPQTLAALRACSSPELCASAKPVSREVATSATTTPGFQCTRAAKNNIFTSSPVGSWSTTPMLATWRRSAA